MHVQIKKNELFHLAFDYRAVVTTAKGQNGKLITQAAGIEHATIHAYSHEENGLVERANKEVIRHLTAILADQDVRKNIPNYLPIIQRIMNTQENLSSNGTKTNLHVKYRS